MDSRVTTYSAVLGHVISALRQQRGLQQSDLANALGVSQASYSRLEGGKAMWTFDQLIVVSEALDIQVEQIHTIFAAKVSSLRDAGDVTVIAAGRANRTGADADQLSVGTLLAGAALGAVLATLITRK